MGDGAARQDSDKPLCAAGGQARGRGDARQRVSDERASPPRRAAEEPARSREVSGGDDELRAIDDLRAQDDDGPSRRVSQREVLARLRREPMSDADAAAQPLHKMMLAISAAGEVRKEMLFALAQRPRDVGTLARDMDLDQPRVSQHLAQLRKVGLVSCVCEGGRKVYSVGVATPNGRSAMPRQVLVTRDIADGGVSRIQLTGSNGFSCVLIDDRSRKAGSNAAAGKPVTAGQPGRASEASHMELEIRTLITSPVKSKSAAKKAGNPRPAPGRRA